MLEEIKSLPPINFFSLTCDIQYGKSLFPLQSFLLPQTSEILGEVPFADLAISWHEEGLFFEGHVHASYADDDRLELFIDTRNMKTAGFLTRFCHHFVIQDEYAEEVTRFRTEDSHPLCNPEDLSVKLTKARNSYTIQIFIPSQCLHGYDTSWLGFTYRWRHEGELQHFATSSRYFAFEQFPSLWATLKLVK